MAAVLLRFVEGIASELGSLTVPYIWVVICLNNEKKKFMSTLSTIKAVLLDAENQKERSHADENWLEMLRHVLYDAEDLVDELSTEAVRQQADERRNLGEKVLNFFSVIPFYIAMAFRMKSIRDRLDNIAADRNKFHPIKLQDKKQEREETHSYVLPTKIIGRDGDKLAIIELLMDSSTQGNVSVIPIVGIGGQGKTALAQLIFNDEKVKTHFELRMWACVSDNFEVKVIVEKILESAINRRPEKLRMNTLQNRLRSVIDGKKYFLVLDNVWNENPQRWDELKVLLMGGARGSKILVTTRTNVVAMITGTVPPYVLKSLPENEAWSLFTQVAFERGQEPENPGLISNGREIVKKCAGVPLIIKVIGSLLNFKSTESDWLYFKNNDLLKIAQEKNDTLPILKLSYDHLPSHLKHCFTYCSLFPKDYDIDKQTLINLWIAQGFVQSSDENQCLEDVGHQYFMDLLLRSFFQEPKPDEWGNVGKCKMHDLMHDLAKSVVGRECASNLNVENSDERTHHISFDFDFNSAPEISIPLLRAKKIRTFLLPVQQPYGIGSTSESACDAFVSKFLRLRVLDLHYLRVEAVPNSIGKLKHLRYLDLSGNDNIKILPNSVTSLQNLQTMKLNNCWRLIELPRDIWKFISLRHLEINKTRFLNHMPRRLGELTSLQTLTRFAVGRDSSVSRYNIGLRRIMAELVDKLYSATSPSGGLSELNGLNNLRGELMIKNLRNVTKNAASESTAANLNAKQYLQSLILQWGPMGNVGQGRAVDELEVLGGLRPHPNLKKLSIYGYGGISFPIWMDNLASCLPNLVKITISNCILVWRHLPPLAQLPSLESLHLYNFPVLESIDMETARSASAAPFFPSLKELKLISLTNLTGWWGDEHWQCLLRPSFPCLSKLHIRNCSKLTSIPLLPCLEELDLRNVSEELLQLSMITRIAAAASFSPLSGLKSLHIEGIKDLESLPEDRLRNLMSLEHLEISFCPRLMSLLGEGFSGLISLRYLTLNRCERLMTLPRGIKYCTTLQQLTINYCSHLEERCQKDSGEDWPKIAHIPAIQINDKWVQHIP